MLLAWLGGIAACVSQPSPQAPSIQSVPDRTQAVKVIRGAASGQTLASACFACHGPQGRSQAAPIPALAGLSRRYFVNVMQAYQYGGRYGSVMGRIALAYDDEELWRMAAYFSRQTPSDELPPQRVDWTRVSQGRRLHQAHCLECHGDLNSAPARDAIRLHGQWMDYLRWTLQDYLVGINQTKAGMSKALAAVVRRHGEEGLEALIQYYGSARP
jgi:sulfide dehydrogenase cytochrome subunit